MKVVKLFGIVSAVLLLAAAGCDEDSGGGTGDNGNDEGNDTGTGEGDTGTGTGEDDDTGPEVLMRFTFDEHDEGFDLEADGWEHNAEEGTMDGVLEYNGPNESTHVQKIWNNGYDFSEALEIEFTIRVNEAFTGGFQLFIKTGEAWDWYDKWINLPSHNEFDEYSFNLQAANGQPSVTEDETPVDISNLRAFGVAMSSGQDAPEGEPGTMSLSIDEIVVK
jgi:hypothetical protein